MRQYLKEIYGIDVIKVNSNVMHMKRKRDLITNKSYRRKKVKNMIVTVDNTPFLDEFSERAVGTDKRD